MAVTDWKVTGTGASVDRDGEPSWVNPTNAQASDNSYAVCTVEKQHYSDWLRCTNFGFSTDDIPSGSDIDGIEVKVEHKGAAGVLNDSALYLRRTSGQIGDNHASAVHWDESDEEVTYGSSDDTWEAGLADTDVVSSDFGVDLSAFSDAGVNTWLDASIDCISIRVYYSPTGEARKGQLPFYLPGIAGG